MSGSKVLVSLGAIALVAACGGGGSGSSSANTQTISGVAAVGAPLARASLLLTSLSSDCTFPVPSTTNDNGSFSFTVNTQTCPGPYLLQVSGGQGAAGNVSAFVNQGATGTTGLVVSPISTAAVALAKGADPLDATQNALLTAERYNQAVGVIYNSADQVFSELSIASAPALVNNPSFVADGTGPDMALELLSIDATNTGSVFVGTKFGSASVELSSLQSTSQISSLNLSVASEIYSALNSSSNCISSAFQARSVSNFQTCVTSNFKEGGFNAPDFFQDFNDYLTEVGATRFTSQPATLNWCTFDNASNNLSQTRQQLSNTSGVCHAQLNLLTNGSPVSFGMHFQFNISNQGVVSSAARGNQVDYYYDVMPAIERKLRVDGLTNNTGISSGYKFDIDTGREKLSNGQDLTENASIGVLSATVELTDASGTRLPGGLFYLQCQQGSPCNNSILSICTDSTCTDTDNTSTAIVRTNSALAQAISQARLTGPVFYEIKAYGNLGHNLGQSGTLRYSVKEPLAALPLAQEDAEKLQFPELTSASVAAMAAWTGQNELNLAFNASAQIPVSFVDFFLNSPRVGDSLLLSPSVGLTQLPFKRLATSGAVALEPQCTGETNSPGSYRSLQFEGVFRSIPVGIKYFGSCSSGDY